MSGRSIEQKPELYGQRRIRDAGRKIKIAEALAWNPKVSQTGERNLMGKPTDYRKIQLPR